jgi:hypothetical protein
MEQSWALGAPLGSRAGGSEAVVCGDMPMGFPFPKGFFPAVVLYVCRACGRRIIMPFTFRGVARLASPCLLC